MLRDALLKVSGNSFAAGQSAANWEDEAVQTAKSGEVAEAIFEVISLVREFVSDAKEQRGWATLWDKSDGSGQPEDDSESTPTCADCGSQDVKGIVYPSTPDSATEYDIQCAECGSLNVAEDAHAALHHLLSRMEAKDKPC